MHVARKNWKFSVLGAAALAALLSTTACEPDGTNNGAGTTATATPSATPSTQPGGTATTATATPSATASTQPGGTATTATATPSATASTQPGGRGAGTTGGSQGSGGGSGHSGASGSGESVTAACAPANISIATTAYAHDSVRHLLLTATNTGDKECALYRYPTVRFDNGRVDQVGPMESEMKGATIGPGKKAYAGMLLFRTGARTDVVETMTVSLAGRVSNVDADSRPIDVPLPDETPFLNIDDDPLVSYWNISRKTVENNMFKAAGGN
ncbi:DUF4232 domain-containing protein [Streptomyces sp. NPDC050287]|uniref:DUF4232 domain-containing protein n=1 Tax=Streptomyces sp. NPDC050287 TaxID=3365608 RepID=UPI0037BDA560